MDRRMHGPTNRPDGCVSWTRSRPAMYDSPRWRWTGAWDVLNHQNLLILNTAFELNISDASLGRTVGRTILINKNKSHARSSISASCWKTLSRMRTVERIDERSDRRTVGRADDWAVERSSGRTIGRADDNVWFMQGLHVEMPTCRKLKINVDIENDDRN